MWKRLRAALARFAVRRAAACQRHAPQRAAAWLRLACSWTPGFGEPYVALVHLSRALQDRRGALATAQEATQRFPENPDAWMLLGDASQMVFRQREALGAYEQALALEERVDAAMAAGELYRRAGPSGPGTGTPTSTGSASSDTATPRTRPESPRRPCRPRPCSPRCEGRSQAWGTSWRARASA